MYLSNSSQKIWVSNLVGNDYQKWNKEFVALDCGTGTGKTYFCIHILGQYANKANKKILYLCNRNKLRRQIFEEVRSLKLSHTIWVTTYQTLQNDLKDNSWREIHYDYIIADECHYFTTDAKFNDYTDVSYKYLMKQKDSVVMWVSATAKAFFEWLQNTNKVKKKYLYSIPKDYSYVQHLYIYQKDELKSLIDDVLENEEDSKIVVFCNSANRIIEMNRIYGDTANYFCSNSAQNTKLKDICGYDIEIKTVYDKATKTNKQKEIKKVKDCIIRKDNKITFEKRILFTTTVLDNGVDLKDENIKHIFSEIIDVDSMLQSLGRKRPLTDTDTCSFYIREYQPKAIQGLLNLNNSQLSPLTLYNEDYEEFFREYGKDRQKLGKLQIFYPQFKKNKKMGEILINECRYNKYQMDNMILEQMKTDSYLSVVLKILGSQLSSISERVVVDVEQMDLFIEYLKSIEDKPLYDEDRERIKAEFETVGVKLRYKGINTFNGALDDLYGQIYTPRFTNTNENNKPLIDKRRKLEDGSNNPYRDKRYWLLRGS